MDSHIQAAGDFSIDGVHFVYSLRDPVTQQEMYVGRTCDVHVRYRQHSVGKLNPGVKKWINKLAEDGQRPLMVVLARLDGVRAGIAFEREILGQRRAAGVPLLNYSPGARKRKRSPSVEELRSRFKWKVIDKAVGVRPSRREHVAERVAAKQCLLCDCRAKARGVCAKHYQHFRFLMVETPMRKRRSVERELIRDGRLLRKGDQREAAYRNAFATRFK